jgi:hypothetical protein
MKILLTREDLLDIDKDIEDIQLSDFKSWSPDTKTVINADIITFVDDNGETKDLKHRWKTNPDMEFFRTVVEGYEGKYNFSCFKNTEPIEIGDYFLMFFGGIADVQICDSESIKEEINKNDRQSSGLGDFVTGFWRNCYKIEQTDFNIEDKVSQEQ